MDPVSSRLRGRPVVNYDFAFESEDGGDSSSDDEIRDNEAELSVNENIIESSSDSDSGESDVSSVDGDADAGGNNINCRWRKRTPPTSTRTQFTGNQFSDPPDEPLTPLSYFKMFVDDEMISSCCDQTNLYATQ